MKYKVPDEFVKKIDEIKKYYEKELLDNTLLGEFENAIYQLSFQLENKGVPLVDQDEKKIVLDFFGKTSQRGLGLDCLLERRGSWCIISSRPHINRVRGRNVLYIQCRLSKSNEAKEVFGIPTFV